MLANGTSGFVARVREHVWAPVAFKAIAIVFGTFLLAGVGVVSSWTNSNGIPIALGAVAPPPSSERNQSAPQPTGPSATRAPPSTANPDGGARSQSEHGADGPSEKIVLNRASADELTKLPGVGRKRAQAIVELRDRLHGFKRVTDLLRIRGIGPRSLKRMLPYLVLDSPPADAGAPGP